MLSISIDELKKQFFKIKNDNIKLTDEEVIDLLLEKIAYNYLTNYIIEKN